ncbi:MAG: T9SS type A sorting domain-containing protein [Paludibacter sp.]
MKKNFLFAGLLFCASLFAQNTIDNSFFDKVNFRGAFGTTDWTTGWTNFTPTTTVYPASKYTFMAGDITKSVTLGSAFNAPASFVNPLLNNSFFTKVDYVGAFDQTDWTAGWANFNPQSTVYSATTVTIDASSITTDQTWTKDQVYLLNGWVYVRDGATLTIEAGTVIRGDKTNKGALIIEKGAKLIANGTIAEPIVFTSNQSAGSRSSGDWGGVIICGKAPVNLTGGSGTIEGGVNSTYGGSDVADNSGSLQYVRIEFPGYDFALNNEINGLTMGGVGSGTTIDNIQVSYSNDDSYEWFGGTVNCKHLIAYSGKDDDFDTDNGYQGMVQFAVSLRNPTIADVSLSNCFESDNNATGSETALITAPIFCNVSSYGPKVNISDIAPTNYNNLYQSALHLRRNTMIKIFNSTFSGWPSGVQIDGDSAQVSAARGDLKLENIVLSGMGTDFVVPAQNATPGKHQLWTQTSEASNWFNTVAYNNRISTENTSLMVNNAFNLTAPAFTTYGCFSLNGWNYVKSGSIFTVMPGVVVRGEKTNKAALIIEKGAKLIANGTVDKPIVFTSGEAAGARNYGDWGGIILCGIAPNNYPTGEATIEGGVTSKHGAGVGTPDPHDNSGSLQYVRIEFPGVAFAANNEINGLTMGSVGDGTTIDNVQVSYSGDDSYEWFGGTVNAKHLIAFRGWDDDFDTDNGFTGMVQYAVALRDPSKADQSKSNCFESDNNAAGSNTALITMPIFSNVSSFGPKVTSSTSSASLYQSAMHLRRSSSLKVYNSIFAGWPSGLQIDGSYSQRKADVDSLVVSNCVLSGMTSANFLAPSGTWTVGSERTWFNKLAYRNDTVNVNTNLKISDPFNLTAPNFLPLATSKMNTGSKWSWSFAAQPGLENAEAMYFTAFANGSQITSAGSKLMVYKNDVCLGVSTVNSSTGKFSLSVGSNVDPEDSLTVKVYDATTQKLYHIPTFVDFNSSEQVGSGSNPKRLDATATLTIPLIKGSNWISFNVLPENAPVKSVLNYTATNGDYISSQTETAIYTNGKWFGLSNLLKGKMYVLTTTSNTPGRISITNQPLEFNEPLKLNAGFNWIGYNLLNAYEINTALGGLNPSADDFLIGQGLLSTYDGTTFDNPINLNPGTGYILKKAESSSFAYPTNHVSTAIKVKSQFSNTQPKFESEVGQRYAMAMYAQVFNNGELYQPEGMQLAVFKDSKCYGSSLINKNTFGVSVGSNSEKVAGMTFKVYDPTTSKYYDLEETVEFDNMSTIGKLSAPVALKIKGLVNNQNSIADGFSAYPNQIESEFNVNLNSAQTSNANVCLFDMQGRNVKTIFDGEINGNKTLTVSRESLKNGMYMIKATVGNNNYSQKVILK